jgi:hypothetical protein
MDNFTRGHYHRPQQVVTRRDVCDAHYYIVGLKCAVWLFMSRRFHGRLDSTRGVYFRGFVSRN